VKAHRFEVPSDELILTGEVVVPDEPRGAVVLFHGIPSIAPPEPGDEGYAGFARRIASNGWISFWVDMRAARAAPGFFSIRGWVRDAGAVIEAARSWPGADKGSFAVVGSSAGGAVALEAIAGGVKADALALLATPASWVSFAGDSQSALMQITKLAGMEVAPEVRADPGPWSDEFETVEAERSIARVDLPILIVHGTSDSVVPVEHAARLAARAHAARVEIVEGAEHQLRREERAVKILEQWLEEVLL
jgi:uncharacterized protein